MRDGEPLRYYEINDDFHSAIYAGSHNAYLEKLTTQTRARIAPFSRAQFRTLGRLAKSYREHDEIVHGDHARRAQGSGRRHARPYRNGAQSL